MTDIPLKQPEELGFGPERLSRAFQVIDGFVQGGKIPGATVSVGTSRGIASVKAFGCKSLEPRRSLASPNTIYDCASLTKVLVTTTLALSLLESGQMRLDDPVPHFVPEFAEEGRFLVQDTDRRHRVTIRHLLTHTSGLPAWIPLFDGDVGWGAAVGKICSAPLVYETGTQVVYSCLGFILLGEVIRRITGSPLDVLARNQIFAPLEMTDSGYNPDPTLLDRIAPTERVGDSIIHGVVHDENARSMGGVSGNAGLFSTATDLARFAVMLLRGGTVGASRILSPATLAAATRDYTSGLNESRGLGWAIKGQRPYSSAGDLFSPRSFGHTGFTGTSIWIDPERDFFAVLLTNRVHPSRENPHHIRLRPLFHNAALAATGR